MSRPDTPRAIPIAGPSITDREIDAVTEAVTTGWYGNAARDCAAFETEFAAHCGRAHAVSLPSCTSAIHLILAALDIGPGDDVIVPDATWIASVAPAVHLGATLRFADVDPTTWCLAADSVEELITPATKAIIAVDLYGGMPDFSALRNLALQHGIPIVEDAAEAIGSVFRGTPAGGFGISSTFSFHGSKTLTTGEGGMLVLDDTAIHARVLRLRDHGRAPGDTSFWNLEVGYKYRMSGLQAALGRAQLQRLPELVAKKRQVFSWYLERLSGRPELMLNAEPDGTRNSYWMSTVVLAADLGVTQSDLAAHLASHEIASRPFFHPLSSLPALREHPDAARARSANEVSARLGTYGINLPSALSLTEDDVDRVCATLLDRIGR